MSEKNSAGKRTARERLIQEREAQKSRDKRRRLLIVASAVVGVLGLAAVAGVVAANSGGDKGKAGSASDGGGAVVSPAGTVGDKKVAVPVGMTDAPSVLTVYEDMRCPACGAFEQSMRTTVNKLEQEGKIRAEYHVVSFIDNAMRGNGSKYAANALGCAQDAGMFHAYHDVLFQNQPQEQDDAFGQKSRLLELAGKVPGLRGPAFDTCVDKQKYAPWVTKVQEDFSASEYKATPTVLLNGESVFPQKGSEQISPANLIKWVDEANKGKRPGTTAPSAPTSASPGAASSGAPTPTPTRAGTGAPAAPGAAGTR
ncbi:DsbA family protein [Streptomyces sp. NPDC004111]|uniref:DsbA family protein n=1 Tax=Streptomyces sp. NPDC004111 TaxID=3364690 RepID=UPI0036C2B081